ncbi:hypothetical protein ACU4GD_38275 [Cupriavidus basilensis]
MRRCHPNALHAHPGACDGHSSAPWSLRGGSDDLPAPSCRRSRACAILIRRRRGTRGSTLTELEFKSLAEQGYNRIPLIAEAFADLETPLSLYLKLAQSQTRGVNTFLLESVVGGERFGRYSFIGLHARTLLRAYGMRDRGGHRRPRGGNP